MLPWISVSTWPCSLDRHRHSQVCYTLLGYTPLVVDFQLNCHRTPVPPATIHFNHSIGPSSQSITFISYITHHDCQQEVPRDGRPLGRCRLRQKPYVVACTVPTTLPRCTPARQSAIPIMCITWSERGDLWRRAGPRTTPPLWITHVEVRSEETRQPEVHSRRSDANTTVI